MRSPTIKTHGFRVLIADDHTLVAELCKNLLEGEFDVVGTVSDGCALVQAASELKPDLVVADIAMPVLNGLDAVQQVKEMLPAVKIVFLTVNDDPEVAAEAFRRGASAYLLKTCASSELVTAIRNAVRGRTYVSQSLPRDTIDFMRRHDDTLIERKERLTKRQREILQLLAEGRDMREIRDVLKVKYRTVYFHKYRIMARLGVKRDADLVRYAVRNHLIEA